MSSNNIKENYLEDLDLEIEEIDFEVIDDSSLDHKDNRDFSDLSFKDFSSDKGMTNKPIRRIVCHNNDEPEIGSDEIAYIVSYKAQKAKGRKSPLAGQNILHIPTPMGDFRIPANQAEKFGKYLINVANSVMKSQTNDNVEQ